MEIVYYPDLLVYSEDTLKSLVLCWGKINTIAPQSYAETAMSYLGGSSENPSGAPLAIYNEILQLAGERILDFITIRQREKDIAAQKMSRLLSFWNRDTHFYNSLRLRPTNDRRIRLSNEYSILDEKCDEDLIHSLLEEKLVYQTPPYGVTGHETIGKAYMSILAEEIKRARRVRLLTDQEFPIAAKAGVDLVYYETMRHPKESYQVVTMAIPQVFISPSVLSNLTWKSVLKIRGEIIPYSEKYHQDLENYQSEINTLQSTGRNKESFDKFCEFCGRVAISFSPLKQQMSKILHLTDNPTLGFITGIAIPSASFFGIIPDPGKPFEIATLAMAGARYALPSNNLVGFEYLERLNRKIQIQRFKNTVSCIIPK